jgi:hypothetical protein
MDEDWISELFYSDSGTEVVTGDIFAFFKRSKIALGYRLSNQTLPLYP